MASKMSFVELFNDIGKYIDDPMSCWKYVVRWKRGIVDTKEPGCFCKDQVYLEGAVEILQNRKTLDFHGLYCGKMSLDDLARPSIAKKLQKDKIKLPPIMDNM